MPKNIIYNVSNRDIILLYAYDLAKQDANIEPWDLKRLPGTAYIRQVEAREILKKYGRSANPGSVHKILQSDYFKRLGENIRSPYIPSTKGWSIVKEYLKMVIKNKEIGTIWKEKNVSDGKLKPYESRILLLDIVMNTYPYETSQSNHEIVKNSEKAYDSNEKKTDDDLDKNDDVMDFVEYMALGQKYKELGLNTLAYEFFERALESNELLMQIPYDMSILLAQEGYYTKALKMRNEYWKRYENYLLSEKKSLKNYLTEKDSKLAQKIRYFIMEGDVSSTVNYFEKLAENIKNEENANSKRMAALAKKYAEELKVLL